MSTESTGPGGATGPTDVVPLPEPLQTREGNLEPFDWFRDRRAEGAVLRDDDRGCWDAFTHDAVDTVLTDPETFSNAIIGESVVFQDTLLGMDPPEHTEKRGLVGDYFTPTAVRSHEDAIRTRARGFLDDAIADGGGTFDVVSTVAYPLPIATIADLLGAEDAIREELKRASDGAIAGPQLSGVEDRQSFEAQRDDAVMNVAEIVNDLVMAKRRDPGDDLVSDLVRDTDLTHYEVIRLCGLLLVAGHVTTTNLITNAVRCLAERPEALATVRAAAREGDHDALDRCVEEVLRFRSPVQQTARIATHDLTVAGREIVADDIVVTWLQSANRDPAVFDDPDTFDPTRDPNPNMAFGRGPHVCLGAHLARLEARVALEELFRRVETLELAETRYEPVEASFLHGVQELPVRYDAA